MTTNGDDPLGKRALFSPPVEVKSEDVVVASRGPEGTDALYSAPAAPGRRGIVVECSKCEDTTALPVLDAAFRLSFFSIWMPFRTYDRWLTCPSCGRRAWCRLRVGKS